MIRVLRLLAALACTVALAPRDICENDVRSAVTTADGKWVARSGVIHGTGKHLAHLRQTLTPFAAPAGKHHAPRTTHFAPRTTHYAPR